MSKAFEFAEMVDEFSVDFVLYERTPDTYADNGDLIEGTETAVPKRGIILPVSADTMRYAPNGTYTDRDREIYTKEPLPVGAEIEYNGNRYTIQEYKDFEPYADVYPYIAKGVGK